MVFSSPIFLFFFLPAFLLPYLCIPSIRKPWLLFCSLFFYAWGEPAYLPLMVCCKLGTYLCGLGIAPENPHRRRNFAIGIIVNVAILIFFKYGAFFTGVLRLPPQGAIRTYFGHLALPLGISFFTFQAISYLVDVYRHRQQPERNLLDLALYISMFPQLVAGPIVRYDTVRRELERIIIHWDRFETGIRFFIGGLAAKVLVANVAAVPADAIFGLDVKHLNAGLGWLATICYTIQIYFDFWGYSLMAIGLGRMIGFEFPDNFRHPYISGSITDFWRRWHISLSTWFRDCVYIPLGGNRGSNAQTCRNLLIVFALCGFWHGATWTFLFWGLYHGAFLIAERLLRGRMPRFPWPVANAYTLLAAGASLGTSAPIRTGSR